MDKRSGTCVRCLDTGFVMLLLCLGLSYGYLCANTAVAVFLLPVPRLSVLFIAQKVQIYTS